MQLGVEGHEDSTESAAGMGAEDAEPQAVGGDGADGVVGGAVGVFAVRDAGRAELGERGLDVGIADSGQMLAGGTARVDGRQALFGIAAMLLEVARDQSLNRNSVIGIEIAAGHEMIGQRAALVAGPSLEGGDELTLVDQANLQREQAEEQVARGVEMRRHDGKLPSLLSLANHPGKVPHRLPREGVAARAYHCNEVPAGLRRIALPRHILGSGADGTTLALRRKGEFLRVLLGKDLSGEIALRDLSPHCLRMLGQRCSGSTRAA